MTYEPKKYDQLVGLLGFSDTMLKNHFTLYEGYVKNVNAINDLLNNLATGTPEYNELRRRFGWEWNGMRLHELYFGNLTLDSKGSNKDSRLYNDIVANFCSFENWLADFKSLGLIRGIGWVALVEDKISGKLMNIWIGEHDLGHLAGENILLIMDVWEHSYMTDYGIKRVDYIERFIQSIDWQTVENRY